MAGQLIGSTGGGDGGASLPWFYRRQQSVRLRCERRRPFLPPRCRPGTGSRRDLLEGAADSQLPEPVPVPLRSAPARPGHQMVDEVSGSSPHRASLNVPDSVTTTSTTSTK